MIQLREKNGYSLSQLANELHTNKSTLSRVEKVGGETGFKTVHVFAQRYCEFLGMSEKQTEMFLRGEKAVVVDFSALFTRPSLVGELCEEYSYVFVPDSVCNELASIVDDDTDDYGNRALELLSEIQGNEQIHTSVSCIQETSKLLIVDFANSVSQEYCCDVDVITNNVRLALKVMGFLENSATCRLLFLEEYVATKQRLCNLCALNIIDSYYADSYESIGEKHRVKIPSIGAEEWNCYLSDGNTLIISAVMRTEIPIEQRKEKIRWLIKNGADVNKRDCENRNFPPITHAIKQHDYEMFSFLLHECNANPNVCSRNPYDVGKIRRKNNGNTPLMVAAWENQIEMVKELCNDKRVSLNQQDANGYTALIKASYRGNKECRNIIRAAGADITILDHEGFSEKDRWEERLRNGRYKERRE